MQEIVHDGKTIAVVVRADFKKPGINFLSHESYPLQVGVSLYKNGHRIKAHYHISRNITITSVQEVVHIESGQAIVTLYGCDKEMFLDIDLFEGDTIFFVQGGHSFTMVQDTKLMEVKQGPYSGKQNDKVLLE